jgi:hypothetical protein
VGSNPAGSNYSSKHLSRLRGIDEAKQVGGRTREIIPEAERKLLTMLPMLSKWIRNDRILTDNEILSFFRQFKGLESLANKSGLNPFLETVTHYGKQAAYKKDAEVILSLSGMKWLDNFNKRACVLMPQSTLTKLGKAIRDG